MFYAEFNEYDDQDHDLRADLSNDIVQELEEEKLFKISNKFKHFICKEPEFYGIKNLSDKCILDLVFLEKKNPASKKIVLSKEIIEYLDDFYSEIFEIEVNCAIEEYKNFIFYLNKKMYI